MLLISQLSWGCSDGRVVYIQNVEEEEWVMPSAGGGGGGS